ncbi:MAG: hypothetical protein KKA62_06260 [Nanoarchaeota archaeon]|nr:hypothetical protein [Nanoarchaeota archaeon]MBU1644167.1 hypothetical protein [Nanoarchaeota archaeon]MBU1977528.1 hypothetical protein [Nanoarchaeota archaeon]
MKVIINEKKDNNLLLGRVEVSGELIFEGVTPSNEQLVNSLAKEFKTDSSLVVMKSINNKFSQQKAKFLAFVYKDLAAKNKSERLTKHLKKKLEEVKKKAAEVKAAELEAKKAAEEAQKQAEEAKAAEEVKPVEEVKEGEQ